MKRPRSVRRGPRHATSIVCVGSVVTGRGIGQVVRSVRRQLNGEDAHVRVGQRRDQTGSSLFIRAHDEGRRVVSFNAIAMVVLQHLPQGPTDSCGATHRQSHVVQFNPPRNSRSGSDWCQITRSQQWQDSAQLWETRQEDHSQHLFRGDTLEEYMPFARACRGEKGGAFLNDIEL